MTALGPAAARLAAFAGLAAFATAHWVSLVEGPPAGRVVLAVAAIVGGAVLLVAIGRARLPRLATGALAALTTVAATALALAAVGLSLALLWPGGWDELGTNIDRGLSGLAGDVDYPYKGANEWSRLAILAAAPLALGLAAALAFWPAPDRTASRLRVGALIAILALYATAVAVHSQEAPLLRGVVLLGLVAAWLWLPVLRRGDLLLAAGLVVVAGAVAVPAAARIDASDPWIDYSDWTWSNEQGVAYRWNHSYGPLDWPRDGTTMFAVESDEPHYWKAIVLDSFDGHRWERSEAGDTGSVGLPARLDAVQRSAVDNQDWLERVDVTVGSLRSEFLIAPGTPLAVDGIADAIASPDGTTVAQDKPLSEGDAYSVSAYVPDPSEDELRAAGADYEAALAPYTEIAVPGPPTVENAGPSVLRPAEPVQVPLRGFGPPDPVAREVLEASPYAGAYRLARRLAAGEPTTYDSVNAIEDYLRTRYAYNENPPPSDYPLASFLFEDRVGYCQQFSGAMALMLRMVGIPSRVVSGFAPGSPDLDQNEVFQVEDFDAHSWVEVYFNDIGWVTFDPTPAAAPAASQVGTAIAPGAEAGGLEFPEIRGAGDAESVRGAGGGGGESSGGSVLWVLGAIVLGLCALTTAAIAVRSARFRRLDAGLAAGLQVRELAGLGRLGWPVRDGETLLGLEWRLRRAGKAGAAGYLAGLRRGRFADGGQAPPTLASRRALRAELTRARGLGARLRGLAAMPPGGPRGLGRSARA